MPNHSEGLHHHRRKQRAQSPRPTQRLYTWQRFIDRAIYFFGLIGPVMTIPQLTKIWIGQSAMGVSVLSWATYLVVAIFWLMYSGLHHDKPMMIISGIWIVLDFFIVLGVVLYS